MKKFKGYKSVSIAAKRSGVQDVKVEYNFFSFRYLLHLIANISSLQP